MEKEIFKELLKKANLNKKQFAELLETEYNTVNAWGTNGRNYPYWVESWLRLYIDNKNCKELKSMIKNSGICD
jgi:DNA-binding transcriptional regulator YiaG